MENEPKPPIFILEGHDVMFFASVFDAALFLHPIDIRNEKCVGYDAEGRLLKLTTYVGDEVTVDITLAEEEPTHANELETELRHYLKYKKDQVVSDPSCNLTSLVEAFNKYIYTDQNPGETFIEFLKKLISKFRGK